MAQWWAGARVKTSFGSGRQGVYSPYNYPQNNLDVVATGSQLSPLSSPRPDETASPDNTSLFILSFGNLL